MFLISLNLLIASVKPTTLTTPRASKLTCAKEQFKRGGWLTDQKERKLIDSLTATKLFGLLYVPQYRNVRREILLKVSA